MTVGRFNAHKVYLLLAMAFAIIITLAAVDIRARQLKNQETLELLQEWMGAILEENTRLEYLINDLYRRRESDNERLMDIEDFLEPARVEPHEITAYAPLDPRAVEGMCYAGDPNVTSSGEPPVPWQTAAAGPGTPFGSRVYVAGQGWYRVNDRGGVIVDGKLDLVVEKKEEAYIIGRKVVPVLIIPTS